MNNISNYIYFLNILRSHFLGLLIACTLLVTNSCSNIKPEEPETEPFLEVPTQKESNINIPIYFEVDKLERKINEKIKGDFYQDNSFDNNTHNLKITLSKYEKVRIRMEGAKMITTLPMEVDAEVLLDKKIIGINIKKKQKISFKVNIDFESDYNLNAQWQVVTHTRLKSLNWIEEPKVKIAFLNIKVTGLVEKALAQNEKKILDKIDNEIKENIHLDKSIGKIWKDIQKPVLVNKQLQKVWLKVDPVSVSVSPIHTNGKHLIINTHIDANLHSIIGDSLSAYHVKELPALKVAQSKKESFDLNVLSNVSFEKINKLLADSLNGKELTVEDHKVKIKKAAMWGSGEKIILKLVIGGDAKGTLYLKGKPEFDAEKEALRITNFTYDVNTEEIILKVANWLYHDEFRNKIQEKLYLPLGDQLEQLPLLIENAIDKGKLGKKITVHISSMKVKPENLIIRPDGIYTSINAKGKVDLLLENI